MDSTARTQWNLADTARDGCEFKASVLLVDDDDIVLNTLQHGLTRAGYRVLTAKSGSEALAKYQQYLPDVTVLDYEIPLQNGAQIARHMLKIAVRPIIMLSAHSDEGRVQAALGSGASGFVVKPVAANQLIPVLTTALAQQSKRLKMQSTTERFGLSLDDLSDLIDSISLGVLVISPQRELIHCNTVGRQLLNNGHYFQLVQNKLCVVDPLQSSTFVKFVDRCFSSDTQPGASNMPTCLIELSDSSGSGKCLLWSNRHPRRHEGADKALSSGSLTGGSNDASKPGTVSILAAIPDQTPCGADRDAALLNGSGGGANHVFKDIYGLSVKENDLAYALISGATIDSFAEIKCRSIHTIRNQLKSLFRKTDTHRQADLVRLLTRINTLMNPVVSPAAYGEFSPVARTGGHGARARS